MYNVNFKRMKFVLSCFLTALMIGLFLTGSLTLVMLTPYYNYFRYNGKAISNDINLNYNGKTYSPTFQFEDNEIIYYCYSNFRLSEKPKENVIIKYDINNPTKCVSSYQIFKNWNIFFIILFQIIFIIFAGKFVILIIKQLYRIKKLNENSILVKDLDYELEDAKIIINGKKLMYAIVKYKSPKGEIVLKSHPLFNEYDDNKIDLIINPDDYKCYYIDYNINYK